MMKEVNKYYSAVNKILPIGKNAKQKFMQDLKESVDEFLDSNEFATYHDILNNFGTPESIALTFMAQENDEETVKRITVKKRIKTFVICSFCLFALITILVYGFVVFDAYRTNHGSFSDEIIIEEIIEE